MNQYARDRLREAYLDGVRQAFSEFTDRQGGECALYVLGYRGGDSAATWQARSRAYGLLADHFCPLCNEAGQPGTGVVRHLNDDHRLDFLKIAEVMP